MASLTAKPSSKWDLERFIYTDPALSSTERFVAIQLLKTLDDRFEPDKSKAMSQRFIGWRIHRWRSTVNRAFARLKTLGYFRGAWRSVNRKTAQGIKGVTRVIVSLGPVLRRLVETGRTDGKVSAGQARGVSPDHPSPPLPGIPGTVSGEVIANSADRKGHSDGLDRESKRKTLAEWPRLAGSAPVLASRLPSSRPAAEANMAYYDPARYRELLGDLDESASEQELTEEYLALAEARASSARRGAAAARDLLQRRQPRRQPRSRRK